MWEPFIALALAMGMRHGELLALQWKDIDLEAASLHIQRTVIRDENDKFIIGECPKTEAGDRIILLPQPVCDILKAHRVRQHEVRLLAGPRWQDQQLVLCTKHGKMLLPHNVRNQFYRFLERVGIPRMRIYDMRHSASTLLRSMGVDIKVIQQILGHKNLDVTLNIYSDVLHSMKEDAAESAKSLFEEES